MNSEVVINGLGTGSAQVILAVCLVALAGVCAFLCRAVFQCHDARVADTKDMLRQQAADARLVAETMQQLRQTIDLTLAALKGGR